MGGGFYDRTLASFASTGHKISAIGIAYDHNNRQGAYWPFDRALTGCYPWRVAAKAIYIGQ